MGQESTEVTPAVVQAPETTPVVKKETIEDQLNKGVVPPIETSQTEQPTGAVDSNEIKFDPELVKNLAPEARQAVEAIQKSMQSDYTKKTQAVAEKIKEAKEQAIGERLSSLTPQDIGELAKNQSFVTALQSYLQSQRAQVQGNGQQQSAQLTQDQWDLMTESEQQAFQSSKAQEDRLQRLESTLTSMSTNVEDQQFKTSNPAYDSAAVNRYVQDLQAGKRKFTRLDAFKALDYENAIKRTVQWLKKQKTNDLEGKIEGSTGFNSTDSSPSDGDLVKHKGESHVEFVRRLNERVKRRMEGVVPQATAGLPEVDPTKLARGTGTSFS